MFWKKKSNSDSLVEVEKISLNIPPVEVFIKLCKTNSNHKSLVDNSGNYGLNSENLGRLLYWIKETQIDPKIIVNSSPKLKGERDYYLSILSGYYTSYFSDTRKKILDSGREDYSNLYLNGLKLNEILTSELELNQVPMAEVKKITQTINGILTFDQIYFIQELDRRKQEQCEAQLLLQQKAKLDDLAGLIVEASKVGDLTSRSDLKNFPDEIRTLVASINTLLDSILVPLKSGIDVIQMVAKRDLTQRIEGDFVGDHRLIPEALNPALDYLNAALMKIDDATERVKINATHMSDSAQSLSSGATQQASSLQQVKETVVNIAQEANENAKSALEAHKLVDNATKHADLGNDLMHEMNDAMNKLHVSAKKISQIIKVIEEIAFQTNMLSLNAAVEAARAGVHGKGFAVVAEEVGSLAKRSSKASKETEQLIQDTITCINNGVEISEKTDAEIGNIQKMVKDVSNIIGQITNASRLQNQEIEEVSEAIHQIEVVTRDNADNAERGATLAYNLTKEAENLKFAISSFKIDGNNQGQYKQRSHTRVISSSELIELPELDEGF